MRSQLTAQAKGEGLRSARARRSSKRRAHTRDARGRVTDLSYSGGGLQVPCLTRQVANPAGLVPAGKGDPATGASAPLVTLIT